MRILLILATILVASVSATQKRYDGYKVYTVKAKDETSFKVLVQLYLDSINYDFWTEPRSIDRDIDIMVPPTHIQDFVHLLSAYGMDFRVKITNVQQLIEEGRKNIAPPSAPKNPRIPRQRNGTPKYSLTWDAYYQYPQIVEFMQEIAADHPDKVSLINFGKSYEGRDMLMVKISTGVGNGTKKAVVSDGAIHAREWISAAYATWMIHELIHNYDAHPQYVDDMDWYIVPVLNPDGYEYTFNGDRLWRKNRAPTNGTCIGTDLNRNYDFHWNEGGSSAITCSEVHHGGAAFNQPESRNMRDAILSIPNEKPLYLSLHSYGQYLLTPWGYTSKRPDDYDVLVALGTKALDKLATVHGTKYVVGTSTELLGAASGCSDDWAKGPGNMPYSYTFEMRDQGTYGFELPADQIIANNEEVWEAVKVIIDSLYFGAK